MSVFKFKQFIIDQTGAPFKVGTDSMVLGSWIQVNGDEKALDIGTGTGILALMVGQRLTSGVMLAVEPDRNAFEIANNNFQNAEFSDKIIAINEPLQNVKPNEKFDLIVCNPPYFRDSTKNANESTTSARHDVNLSLETLAEFAKENLSETGLMYTVLPVNEAKHWEQLMTSDQISVSKRLLIKNDENAKVKRVCSCISFSNSSTEEETLVLKNKEDNSYTEEYKTLTANYHLYF